MRHLPPNPFPHNAFATLREPHQCTPDASGTCQPRLDRLRPKPILLLLYLNRRRLKARIHGRPRSDRKRRFLLSAVAPSTIARHPREARPINWAQRGGLASGGELSNAEATFHRALCTLGNQVVDASDGPPSHRRAVRLVYSNLPGPGSGLLGEASTPIRHPGLRIASVDTGSDPKLKPVAANQADCRVPGPALNRAPSSSSTGEASWNPVKYDRRSDARGLP
jgi:hypothetical protein